MRVINSEGFYEYSPGEIEGIAEIQTTDQEQKEVEPKRVVFKLSLHIKEGMIADFLGDLETDLKQENSYVQAPHKEVAGGPGITTKGGRSLNILGQLAEANGMSIVGIKWREDETTNKKTRAVDKGLGLVLEFGYGKTDFDGDEQTKKWQELSKKVFEDYLWDCIYYENGDRIGLFGPQKVVTKTDGSRLSDRPDKQMFIKDVTQELAKDDRGMKYTWGKVSIVMPF